LSSFFFIESAFFAELILGITSEYLSVFWKYPGAKPWVHIPNAPLKQFGQVQDIVLQKIALE
jgi:hypothetical protein